jgi:predicted nucleotidyltransferase
MDTIVSELYTADALSDVLFGRTRRAVLGLLYGHPDESFYLREVSRRTGQALGAVQRELAQLVAARIVERERVGNQVRFRADPRCPVYPELKSLVTKTVGAAGVIRDVLATLGNRVQLAFLFGSFAQGQQRRESDIDLVVVGEVSFEEISAALTPAEQRLGRPVNPMLYSPAEFQRKRAAQDHFITSVLAEPKILLIGGSGDRNELGPVV